MHLARSRRFGGRSLDISGSLITGAMPPNVSVLRLGHLQLVLIHVEGAACLYERNSRKSQFGVIKIESAKRRRSAAGKHAMRVRVNRLYGGQSRGPRRIIGRERISLPHSLASKGKRFFKMTIANRSGRANGPFMCDMYCCSQNTCQYSVNHWRPWPRRSSFTNVYRLLEERVLIIPYTWSQV